MAFGPFRTLPLGATLHWSRAAPVDARGIAVAALGMTVPVLAGLALGRAELGFTIGLGAMLLAGGPDSPAQERPSPASAILPAALALTTASAIAGFAWADPVMILLAGVAAAISGYSRPVGVAAVRFIIYLVLSATLLEGAGSHRGGAALAFGLGALWNVAIRFLLAPRRAPAMPPAQPARTPTPPQRRAHWRRTLRDLAGWQFPIRIVAGLGAASVLRHLWPSHHFGWIVLTVALLTQRPIEQLPVKTVQRALGTALGVALTWAIVTSTTAPVLLGAAICLLATLAPIARARSYLAWSTISTPVILLVIDLGRPVETALLVDRLVATLCGAAIVLSGNAALDRLTRRAAPGI